MEFYCMVHCTDINDNVLLPYTQHDNEIGISSTPPVRVVYRSWDRAPCMIAAISYREQQNLILFLYVSDFIHISHIKCISHISEVKHLSDRKKIGCTKPTLYMHDKKINITSANEILWWTWNSMYAECSLHTDQIFRKELLTLTLTKVIDNEGIDNLLSFH